MKKFIRSLVLIICVCTFVLCGCGKSGLKDNPPTDAAVIGNGGYAVQKGDYLYYVNGYLSDYRTSLSNYKKDNVFGKVIYGAIYRTKLVNNNVQKDENGFLTNTECVVPKVVGFENGGFYIVGDYIYYGTPYMKKNADGVLQNDRVVFNRIKIDGTGNKEMYVTGADVSAIDWTIYDYNDSAYLVVAEDKKITSVHFEGKKILSKVVAEEVTNFKLNESLTPANEYVYYTRPVDEDEKNFSTSGNLICKASFVTGEETAYELDKTSTFDIKAYINNRIYFTQSGGSGETKLWALNANVNLKNQTAVQLSDAEYSSYYFVDEVPYQVVALDSSQNLLLLENKNNDVTVTNIASSISTVVGVSENYVYYIDSSTLKRVDLDSKTTETVSGVGEDSEKKFMLSDASQVELDGKYVYVYASYTSVQTEENADGETTNITSYYLNRIDTSRSEMVGEFVGQMEEKHLPAEPEVDEETGEKPQWVY